MTRHTLRRKLILSAERYKSDLICLQPTVLGRHLARTDASVNVDYERLELYLTVPTRVRN